MEYFIMVLPLLFITIAIILTHKMNKELKREHERFIYHASMVRNMIDEMERERNRIIEEYLQDEEIRQLNNNEKEYKGDL